VAVGDDNTRNNEGRWKETGLQAMLKGRRSIR